MTNQAETASQEVQTKYDEFQKACKTILPKVDRKLIEDFLFRQQEASKAKVRNLGKEIMEMEIAKTEPGYKPNSHSEHYRIALLELFRVND